MTDKIEILNERSFPVDRQTLFGTFADPQTLVRWWGPNGFSNCITTFDFRPGGTWLISMTASDGTDFRNRWSFDEIVPGERIRTFHHEPMHAFALEMIFADNNTAGSRLTWRMLFEPTEENRELEHFLHAANEQNFDRLAAVLDQDKEGP